MPKTKLPQWTVVGFYEDNSQPYVVHILATTPQEAAERAIGETSPEIRVVEVFKGQHVGMLGNNEVI